MWRELDGRQGNKRNFRPATIHSTKLIRHLNLCFLVLYSIVCADYFGKRSWFAWSPTLYTYCFRSCLPCCFFPTGKTNESWLNYVFKQIYQTFVWPTPTLINFFFLLRDNLHPLEYFPKLDYWILLQWDQQSILIEQKSSTSSCFVRKNKKIHLKSEKNPNIRIFSKHFFSEIYFRNLYLMDEKKNSVRDDENFLYFHSKRLLKIYNNPKFCKQMSLSDLPR